MIVIFYRSFLMQLQLKAAYETERLQPPHRFVPWVIVNNKTLEQVGTHYPLTNFCLSALLFPALTLQLAQILYMYAGLPELHYSYL